jgi:hypothetical protein
MNACHLHEWHEFTRKTWICMNNMNLHESHEMTLMTWNDTNVPRLTQFDAFPWPCNESRRHSRGTFFFLLCDICLSASASSLQIPPSFSGLSCTTCYPFAILVTFDGCSSDAFFPQSEKVVARSTCDHNFWPSWSHRTSRQCQPFMNHRLILNLTGLYVTLTIPAEKNPAKEAFATRIYL